MKKKKEDFLIIEYYTGDLIDFIIRAKYPLDEIKFYERDSECEFILDPKTNKTKPKRLFIVDYSDGFPIIFFKENIIRWEIIQKDVREYMIYIRS